ncbi:uncharacterized protein LOC120411713 isoform X3 [Corvus cornix cornix]|uniref:uncharacterized protein LOC120411713 isoform X3 n=1 Tax=Corvus cornix cornix TaxID=932674 RepID=UPI00194E3F6D|nr:uncharacterized protein LOC120411713 isoform X3 [Corvus cornix cornix]
MRDQRNTRKMLQEKHKLAMKGKTLPGSSTKVQPPVSAAGSFPSESSRIPDELQVLDVPQPPLKGILIARLPKDGPSDLAGVQAGDRVAEATFVSEPAALDAGPTEASPKGSPFPTVNHVITIPRIILTRPSTSDEDADQLPPDPDDFEPEEPDSAEGHAYSDCLRSAFYPP